MPTPPQKSAPDDALSDALIELAEAEAAEAEARAAVARARARAARSASSLEADGEAESPADPKVSAVQEKSTRRRPRVTWSRVMLALGVLAICAVLAMTAQMVRAHHQVSAGHDRDAEFVAAARRGVEALLSIDYSNARADVQRVIDDSTGGFHDDFAKNADDFIKAAQDSKAVSKGTVVAAAVDTTSGESATVALAATSQVSNANGAKQDPRTWRMSVTVMPDDGRLKISNVEFVQ